MNRAIITVLGLAVLGIAACSGSEATIQVRDAWIRSTPPSADNAAAYMTITSPLDDRLIGVFVDPSIAADVSLHESLVVDGEDNETTTPGSPGGAMAMMEVAVLDIPKGIDVLLRPGGLHVMLTGLVVPLAPPTTVSLTLRFELGGDVVVHVAVSDESP